MEHMLRSRLAGLLWLVCLCAGRSEADVVILGTRVIFAYRLAAWRLRGHLRKDGGDLWTRAANYHSRTPRHNARYREQLMRRAWRWSQWLRRQFNTHSIDDIRPPSPPADHRIGQPGEANMAGVRNHGDHPAWP
ncbi:hypothetical protein FHW84_000927 [Dyella sp. SG562]|nr:hypothetical protein [Dyella sp. SG562]NKJ23407.1 hypothetical protein [Dyella sp. SG609]